MATDDATVPSHGDDLDPLGDTSELEANVVQTLPTTVDDLLPAEADAIDDDATEDDGNEYDPNRKSFQVGKFLTNMGAFSVSVIFHVVLLVVLGLLIFEDTTKAAINTIVATVMEERPEDAPVEIELNENIEQVDEQTMAVFSPSAMGAAGPAAAAAGEITFDQTLVETADKVAINVSAPTIGIPDTVGLIEAVPEGDVKGDPRAIVENYEQAFDAITQEIMWMLDKGPVLVMWCFDQSESMKDDQREIRERVANVYNQLGIVEIGRAHV